MAYPSIQLVGGCITRTKKELATHASEIVKILSPQKELPSSPVIEEIQDNAEQQTQIVKRGKKSSPVEVTPTKTGKKGKQMSPVSQ